ncbi:MAG: DUF790 family protein [Thermoplasmataceae archaeon]
MFPKELLSVRRDRKRGKITPIFIGSERRDYAAMVRDTFTEMTGKRRTDIQKKIREIELKVEHNKVIKGIAEIMFRNSQFTDIGRINPQEIREKVFLMAPSGVVTQKDRHDVLSRSASDLGISPDELEDLIYADNEDEQRLLEIANIDDAELCLLYNMEQVETLLLRSYKVVISETTEWSGVIDGIKKLGLFFTADVDGEEVKSVTVDGPLSVLEESKRYSMRFAQLLRYVLPLEKWKLEAHIAISEDRKEEKFLFTLSDSALEFLPSIHLANHDPMPQWLLRSEPLVIGGRAYFPSGYTVIDQRKVFIEITRPEYLEYNKVMQDAFIREGLEIVFAYVVSRNQKAGKFNIVYKEHPDFVDLWNKVSASYSSMQDSQPKRGEDKGAKSRGVPESLAQRINSAWPDTDSMISIIESNGLEPGDTLTELGYNVVWRGLSLEVKKREHS